MCLGKRASAFVSFTYIDTSFLYSVLTVALSNMFQLVEQETFAPRRLPSAGRNRAFLRPGPTAFLEWLMTAPDIIPAAGNNGRGHGAPVRT
jgi:hypothetical protein